MLVMKKLTQKPKILDLINRFPAKTNRAIAKETGCNRTTVAKYRKEIDLKYDSEFVKAVAGKFIKAFGRAEEYWLNQITELEELKNTKKVNENPMGILAICKQQSVLQEKILYLASTGGVRQVINMMRVGKIPMLERE